MAKKWIERLSSMFGTASPQLRDGQQEKKGKFLKGQKQRKLEQEKVHSPLQSQLPTRENSSLHSTRTFTFEKHLLSNDVSASSTISTPPFERVFTSTKQTDFGRRKLRHRLSATSTAPYATWIKADEDTEPYVVGQSIDTERFKCLESLDPETQRNLMIDIVRPLCIYEVLLNIKKSKQQRSPSNASNGNFNMVKQTELQGEEDGAQWLKCTINRRY